MELLGQTVEARPLPATSVWAFAGISALMLIAATAASNVHWAIGAIFPAVLAGVEWLRRPGRRTFVVESHGLVLLDGGQTVPYESIREVTVNGVDWCPAASSKVTSPILIHHERGVLKLPPRLSIPAESFRQLLRDKAPAPEMRECPAALEGFYAENVVKFGPEKVTLVLGRRRFHPMSRWHWLFSIAAAAVLSGACWVAVTALLAKWFPNPDQADSWGIAGMCAIIVGAPFWMLAAWSSTANGKSRHLAKNSGIVVSPSGMAMVQGHLQGVMRWEEVRKVHHVPGGSSITLTVPGATLMIMNIYARSLDEIAMLIRRNAM